MGDWRPFQGLDPQNPWTYFIFSLPSKDTTLTYLQPNLYDTLLLLAQKCILTNWAKDKPATVTLWFRELFRVIPHEQFAAILGGNKDLFLNVWSPLLIYLLDDLSRCEWVGCL